MLQNIKTPDHLAAYLGIKREKLDLLDPETSFLSFFMDKPDGSGKRLIETPKGELRTVLDKLCDGLQWLYHDHKTDAAYGFIRTIKPEKDKRDIYTNARRHIRKKYLINIDLNDFFHQVDTEKVRNIFSDYKLFSFDQETGDCLTKLVTYHGRLPMGSPTSPPLSNFAAIELDNGLQKWANQSNFTYTRYVDDMSFSSNMKISDTHLAQIESILNEHQFKLDPNKTKWYGTGDLKQITGLIVDDKVSIPESFLHEFEKDLAKYREILACARQFPDAHVFDWLEKLRQILNGRLVFMQMIYGEKHQICQQFRNKIEQLNHGAGLEQSFSWRYAGYEIF